MNFAFNDDFFCCAMCQDDDDPNPRIRRRNRELCVRCDRAQQNARRYRLTVAGVNAILRSQNDSCALCQEQPNDFDDLNGTDRTFWCIDHDHACCGRGGSNCGQCVRGILCQPCNATRLPAYERLPEILRDSPRFNNYLNHPPARQPEAQVTDRDLGAPRGPFTSILDAFFA
ncbi:endonuclease domain-containing protein [Streptomyces sp. NPDC000229]|uniref:endonuclease domain-containing protein n=1 Tax=Streptomyces sp. NPDC000229 TaxID=3154247 RepID=UPI00332DD851